MKKLFLILALFASLSLEAQFVTTFAKNATENQSDGIIYYLPKSVIQIEFTIEETDYYIGPYAEFTTKMLGVSEYIRENKSEYKISGVDIQTFSTIDSNAVYYISPDEKNKMPNVILDNDGVILSYGYDSIPAKNVLERNSFTINDLETPERVEASFIEILNSEVDIDDDDNGKHSQRQITDEDKAKVALEKISALRNAYYELITGSQEVAFGEVTKYMAETIKNLENEYISLFKGKTIKRTYKKIVCVTPESNQITSSLSIGKISKTDGFSDANGKGETIRIQFNSQNSMANIEKLSDDDMNAAQPNKLFYRIPATSNVKILVGSSVIAEKSLTICQFGYINTSLVKNNKALFNPNTGQIISITK